MRRVTRLGFGCLILAAQVGLGSGCAERVPPPPVAAARPATFEIVLHRPVRVGDGWRQDSAARIESELLVTRGDATVQREQTRQRIAFRASVRVLSVDERGLPVHAEYFVDHCVWEQDGEQRVLLQPGTALRVTRGVEGAPFRVTSGIVDKTTEQLLARVVPTSLPAHTDDEVLGTAQPVGVGAAWAANGAALALDLSRGGFRIDPEGIHGRVRLVGKIQIDAEDLLEMEAVITAHGVTFPGLPAKAQVEKGELNETITGLFPVDPRRHSWGDTSELTAELVWRQPGDPDSLRRGIRVRQEQHNQYRALLSGQ